LANLGRREEAIDSYNKAIALNPNLANAFYNRACCHSLMGNLEMALEDLTIAFRLNPEHYRQLATTDSDLDPLRELTGFISLMETTNT
jgi:tetratricopeptide (TPR) repeat protein